MFNKIKTLMLFNHTKKNLLRLIFLSMAMLLPILFNISGSSKTIYTTQVMYAVSDSLKIFTKLSNTPSARRVRATERRFLTAMPDQIKVDTSKSVLEAIRALPRDSSARISQFLYKRKDNLVATGIYKKTHPLFLSEPAIVKYKSTLDSTKWVYRLRVLVDDFDRCIPTDIALEDYAKITLNNSIRKNWESLVQPILMTDETTSLSDIFSKITKIDIPVPKNPLFSIFGSNHIMVQLNGAIDIEAGFRSIKYDVIGSDPYMQDQSAPTFKQQIQANVLAEIGDKLKIDADWNTQRTFEYENQLHVRYVGYEDEIIQSVEAGNVALPINSSFISGGSSLFGIKSKMQFGPLQLTMVATQQKGEKQEASTSGVEEEQKTIRLTEYSKNHYFVDTLYIKFYEELFKSTRNVASGSDIDNNQIVELEAWVSVTSMVPDPNYSDVIAFMDADSVVSAMNDDNKRRKGAVAFDGKQVVVGTFRKLEQSEYSYDSYAGILSLNFNPNDVHIAVSYTIKRTDGTYKYIGHNSIIPSDPEKYRVLKLVRPRQFTNSDHPAWDMMLKNRYTVGGINISEDNFSLSIEYQLPSQVPQKQLTTKTIEILQLVGLDRHGKTEGSGPDGNFDFDKGVTLLIRKGAELVFPYLQPFSKQNMKKVLSNYFTDTTEINQYADSLSYDGLYTQQDYDAQLDIKNRYTINISSKGMLKDVYSIGFNTIEGSVKVIVDGQPAVLNQDYTVEYFSGTVTITNKALVSPGRKLSITYETNDIAQFGSKSLFGARGDVLLSKNSSLGFTMLKYSEETLSDKVRMDEEPISNWMFGIDGRTTIDAPWITNGLNLIPGIETTAPSSISLSGELAYMLPNPNTRESPVSNDGNKGVAYIDDFEGSRQIISVGVMYFGWKEGSAPYYHPLIDNYSSSDMRNIPTSISLLGIGKILPNNLKMEYKANATWFNTYDINVNDIWEKKSVVEEERIVQALNYYYRPNVRGAFNYSLKLDSTIGLDLNTPNSHRNAWSAIQTTLGSSSNLQQQKIEFIELWMKIVQNKDSTAKLYINLGAISEDVNADGYLNTEDGLGVANNMRTGVVKPGFNWGLDTINNELERQRYQTFVQRYPNHPEFALDPSGDDGVKTIPRSAKPPTPLEAERYFGVNGTEDNDIETRFPDSEDLNGDNALDVVNSYFEYEIPLDPASEGFQKYISGKNVQTEWYQLRIPLNDYLRKIGNAEFSYAPKVRLWVTGAQDSILFRIVDLNLVGNQWEKPNKSDSSYQISVVNFEDNPDYRIPPGLSRQKDRAQADKEIFNNEQSLSVIVHNLQDDSSKIALRDYENRPLNFTNYKSLKLFVHGQENYDLAKGYAPFEFVDTTNYSAEFFIRFGDDIYTNYYEYRAPLRPGWIGNDVIINFDELSVTKAARDSSNYVQTIYTKNGPAGSTYSVIGEPRLDKVKKICIGITNPKFKGAVYVSGELWVNELRLYDVDDTPGWAYKFDANIRLGDISTISFGYSETNPFFHQIEQRFGSRISGRTWNLATTLSIGKLLPESWEGTILDFSYSHVEAINKYLYINSTDVSAKEAIDALSRPASKSKYKNADEIRALSEFISSTDSYALPTIKFAIPIDFWLITETINKTTFGYSYTITRSRDPQTEFNVAWSWRASLKYGTMFDKENYLMPFSVFGDFFLFAPWKDFKFYYTPQSLNFYSELNRSQQKSKNRISDNYNYMHSTFSTRGMDFNWQFFENGLFDFGLSYSVAIRSTLDHLDLDQNNQLRDFSDILGDIFFNKKLINFGKDRSYNQNVTFNTKLSAPKLLLLDKIFTPNFRYGVNYTWSNENTQNEIIGKTAGWGNNPNFTLGINIKPISDLIWEPNTKSSTNDSTYSWYDISNVADMASKILFKYTLFDFGKFDINFTQTNGASNNAVLGGTGFANIFARVPFIQSSKNIYGPSLLYQLGFISDPHGDLVLKSKSTFPFFYGYTNSGRRAPNANDVMDNFSQTNKITLATSRPLWEGVTVGFNWVLEWSHSKIKKYNTNEFGLYANNPSISSAGGISRSFMSFPQTFIFKIFKTNPESVYKKYQSLLDINDGRTKEEKASQAFEEGMEAFPWLKKILGSFAPRANWNISWSGLENIALFKPFTMSLSLSHAYNSAYTNRWTTGVEGGRIFGTQSVSSGFAPLLGIDIRFKEFWKGSINASIRYNLQANYDLAVNTKQITENSRNELVITAGYSLRGFNLPIFGISLKNNLDIFFNFSTTTNKPIMYYLEKFSKDGELGYSGSTMTTLGPRIKYNLSERVEASLYYLYSKTKPMQEYSQPGTTETSGGLDLKITIQ